MSSIHFTPAWLGGSAAALEILPRRFADPAERRRAVGTAASRAVDPRVLASLDAQTAAQREARDKLGKPGTVCVVTGQQAGLFGGPLYTLYKTAAAIANARQLQAETDHTCVAVFWLQNEDHDFAEIAQCTVLDSSGALAHLTLPDAVAHALRSVAFRTLDEALAPALTGLETALGDLPHAEPVLALIRDCYRTGRTIDHSFRALIQALFGHTGLLILDPSRSELAAAVLPVHQRAITEADPIAAALGAHAEAMSRAGFTVQVHVRPDSPLSFIHPQGRSGPRYRIERAGDVHRLCATDKTITQAAVDAALRAGSVSTSALLRPILQDTWLPTAAYVGGPGEIAYLAQLPPLYQHFGLPMPLVVPRARFRVGDGLTRRLLRQLNLEADDLTQPWPALLEAVSGHADAGADPDQLRDDLMQGFLAGITAFRPAAEALDRNLGKAAARTESTVVSVIDRLVDRYRRTRASRDAVVVDRLRRLRRRLSPDGAPQERVFSWPHCAARYGIETFTQAVLEAVCPFDGSLKDLQF